MITKLQLAAFSDALGLCLFMVAIFADENVLANTSPVDTPPATGPAPPPPPTKQGDNGQKVSCNIRYNKVEGNIYSLSNDDIHALRRSLMDTKILVNYGQYVAYPKEDGSFEVDNLPSDSYVLEVLHPRYIYDPVRVDITSKGKIRARRVNYIQPSFVQQVNYPLSMKPISMHRYFTPRETWRFMDILMNPMVLTMVAPLVLFWLLPKMMNSAEAQDQLRRDNSQQGAQIPEFNVPELSEMMTNMFRPGNGNSGRNNQQSQQALPTTARSNPISSGTSRQTRRR